MRAVAYKHRRSAATGSDDKIDSLDLCWDRFPVRKFANGSHSYAAVHFFASSTPGLRLVGDLTVPQ
jgi:hypothetical protein